MGIGLMTTVVQVNLAFLVLRVFGWIKLHCFALFSMRFDGLCCCAVVGFVASEFY